MKILVADDSQPIRARLVERLSRLPGVTVAEAEDTPQAIRQTETIMPDVAVLDIRMPGGGGIKALDEIKKIKPSTTVIIMTNYPYAQYRRKCLEAGADFFFDKSTEFELVAETIRQLQENCTVSEVAHRTAAAQLVTAKEELEKTTQRHLDMSLLSLLDKPSGKESSAQAYGMWEKTFDAMPDLVSIFDADRRIVRVNKAMADRLGVPAAELTGKKCYECVHGTDCPVEQCPHGQMQVDGQAHTAELYEEHLGGWFNISVSPIIENGRRIGAIHVAHDITIRKQAEAAFRQSERDLRHVISAMNDGLWDWDIEHDIMKCSPQAYRMIGYEPDEFPMSYAQFEELLHPDDRARVKEAVRGYFCGETDLYNIEFRLRRKDGTYAGIWARGSLLDRNAEGKPSRMMGILSDVTEKRQAENSLQVSEMRYRQLFESMQSGFALHEIICDGQGIPCDYRFLEINSAFEKLTGLRASDLIGRTVMDVMPNTETHWIEVYGKVALTGEPMRIEEFSAALGRYYTVSAYSPAAGQFATIVQDITEQKNAEETVNRALKAAEEANRVKTQFLANMSHELRTPLNAIIGLTELLKSSSLDEEQLDFVRTIGVSGESLLTIIADLLDFSKIEMGKLTIKSDPFAVREVVHRSAALLASFAETKGLKLSVDMAADVPEYITGDADRLQQILVNLLNNSLKFTDRGGVSLTVRARKTPSGTVRLEFSVKDSGVGMDEDTMKRIFQPFQQGDNSNTREHGGTGLGLAISKNLVEMMGGLIHVESRPGEGSCFSFYLADQSVVPSGLVPISEIRDKWKGRCVCVWGDDPADMRAAEVMLERCGIMPRYAETLDSINNRLTKETPADAVLCNLDMPGLMERLSEFRKLRPEVPWIAFSRWAESRDETVSRLFSAFIDRPLKPEQFYAVLTRLEEARP